MSTRWQIAAKLSDGRFACIYVHYDGYPSCALKMLRENYADQEKIDRLIGLGDCFSVGAEIEKCDTFLSEKEPWEDVCPSYGESLEEVAEAHRHGDEEYIYQWDGSAWKQAA